MAKLKWNGRQIQKQVRRAAVAAVDETMAEAIQDIRQRHPWTDRSGEMTRSIEVLQPAEAQGRKVRGVMGSKLWYSGIVEARSGRPMAKARDKAAEKLPERMRREFNKGPAVLHDPGGHHIITGRKPDSE